MMQSEEPKVHIGYYLKTVDNLLTLKMDSIHTTNKITRAEWQILNSIAEKPEINMNVLVSIVKEFTDYSTAISLIQVLIEKGLVVDSDSLKLTASGEQTYAKALKMQKEFREKAMQGIKESDYEVVISVLEKMINNLSD